MAFDFTGKRVWVTGAGRGIGREVATQFVAAGACVVGLDLAFPEADYPYATRLLDIGDSKAVNACCAALLADGGLDVLVNGAGVLRLGPTDALSDDDWHDCMTVNASGVFYLLRALVPHFKGQQRGAIVTIGSNAAHVPRMQMAAYCASKAAVIGLTKAVAADFVTRGIRCNAICPGTVESPSLRQRIAEQAREQGRSEQEVYQAFVARQPIGRIGTTEEAIETAPKLGFDTGLTVKHPLDEGWHLPIWIANFVLMDYGTGAIFGSPAHDERDHEFATKYGLPIRATFGERGMSQEQADAMVAKAPYVPMKSETVTYVRGFAGKADQTGEAAVDAAIAHAEANGYGEGVTKFRLRDWGISRQRYWGCPIPVLHCDACGTVPEAKENLPVLLPQDVSFDVPGNPLDRHPTWRQATCPQCGGARFNDETLEVTWQGRTIADILELTVDEAAEVFAEEEKIYRAIATLQAVGLGYLRLGQGAPELSGGEAQRIKLATELQRSRNSRRGHTVYLLDEPTTGLHPADIDLLNTELHKLADAGHTVIVVEHDLSVMANADRIIEMGPGAGEDGGRIIADATPAQVAAEDTATGRALSARRAH